MKKVLKYFLCSLFISTCFFLQKGYANDFIKYTSKNGLSIDIVDFITQDKEGFLYFGTPSGLNIFNGTSFKIYNSKNTKNFSNQIKCLLPINDEIILIGSYDKGLYIYNKLYGTITPLKLVHQNKELFLQITALQLDIHDTVWVGTLNNGLLKININQITEYNSQNSIDFTSIKTQFNKSIRSILTTPKMLWVGTQQNGLFKFDLNASIKSFVNIPTAFKDIWDVKLYGNNLYLAEDGGFEIINLNDQKSTLMFTNEIGKENVKNVIRSISRDHMDRLWLGTLNDGLYAISIKNHKLLDHYINDPTDSRTLNINKILTTYHDSQGNLWLGTWYGGINKLNLNSLKFKNYKYQNKSNDLSQNITWNIIPFTNDNYLIGTNGNGICQLNPQDKHFQKTTFLNELKFVSSLYWDDKINDLWVGTWENGLIKYNFQTGSYKNILEKKDKNLRIYKVIKDNHGIIWFGTNSNGLYSLNTKDTYETPKQHFVYANHNTEFNSDNIDVRSILVDNDNILWIGSFEHGVLKVKTDNQGNVVNSTLINVKTRVNNKFTKLRNLYKDAHNNIWIAYENGVVKYNIETYQLTEITPFNDIVVTGFLENTKDEYWVSTYNGLYKYQPSTGKIQHFFQENIINSVYKDPQTNKIWLASNFGMYSFFPKDLSLNTDYPKIVLSNFKDDQNLGMTPSAKTSLKLNYQEKIKKHFNDNSFMFKVSTLFFGETKENTISYQLVNYDTEWNHRKGGETIISYKNIPAGKYELKIRALNQYGVVNPETKNLTITILSPWWATKPAYFIYFVLILLLLFYIKYEISKNQKIKIYKINKEKEQELNDLKLSFFTNISHDIRTPLTLIMGPIESLLAKDIKGSWANQQHYIIRKNTDLLLKLVNQILDFRKLDKQKMKLKSSKVEIESLIHNCIIQFDNAAKEKELKIVLINTTSELDLWIDANKMEKVFINLLSNAIKYSDHQKDIIIKIEKSDNHISIEVVNFGMELKSADLKNIFERFYQSKYSKGGSGIGLSIVKSIIDLHQGTITARSKSKKRTTFTIKLPLGNQHLTEEELFIQSEDSEVVPKKTFDIVVPNQDDIDDVDKAKVKETILIIEDNDDIRNYLTDCLQDEYTTIDVSNGELGVEKAQILIPSLILCDIMMDGIDGIEVCKRLKTNIDTSHIPIILLTAKNTDEDKISGYEIGADDYITKPFNTYLLKTRILNLLEQRKRLKEKLKLPNIEPKAFSPTSVDETFMKKTMLVLEKHISNNLLSVEDLAQEIGMSQTQFYRKIKNLTGFSASKFIQVVRLKRAAQMLSTKKFKVSEVLYEVGFSSPSYFTKCFKKQFGKSPTEFLEND